MNAGDNNAQRPEPHREAIEATAGVWLSLRDRGMTPSETEAFVRWLQESPEHAATFASLEQAWQQLDQLSSAVATGASANPDTLAPRYRRRISKFPLVSLAAAAVFALLCAGSWGLRVPRHFAETAVGAFQRVYLPDGSVAQLNTDSAIDADMAGPERRVRVVRGEVHFSVHKDSLHPFLVAVGGIQVRAVGTAFDVRSRPIAGIQGSITTEIIVTEGFVQVTNAKTDETMLAHQPNPAEPAVLGAGEKVSVHSPSSGAGLDAVVSHLSGADLQRALAWQERRLEFDDAPLRDVVAEFNRYNRVKLSVRSDRLLARQFSGTFRVDGYEAFVILLEENFDVAAKRVGDEIQLTEK